MLPAESSFPNCVPQSPIRSSVMTRWPSKRSVRARQSPRIVPADVAHAHRLGHVGRTELNHNGFRFCRLARRNRCSPRAADCQRLRQRGRFEPEIQEAGPGDLHFLANLRNFEFGEHVRSELTRIQFARLGQRHHSVALVIAKLRVGTRTDQNGGDISVWQLGADGGLEL